ncbi:MAG TPA: hypothetical protein VKS25_09290 [Solirubrobacteraceae bacterium]|nr:hypothetical protein [Solirubrobacteraceae bacterium]
MHEPDRESDPLSGPGEVASPSLVTAADTMTLEQARGLSGRRGARLVLLMGEAGSGKTTLLATLWERLLESGELAGHGLAGSRTALGFERRAHWQRLEARSAEPAPPATEPAEAFLHLRIRRPDGKLIELLLSDLAGAQFEPVREGRSSLAGLPGAARVDRAIVVVDGATLGVQGHSEVAVTRAERLLFALQTGGAFRDTARIALVVTKADAVAEAGERALARHEVPLATLARQTDPEATWIRTAALAADGGPQGLGALLSWLCIDDRPREPARASEVASARSIASFRA